MSTAEATVDRQNTKQETKLVNKRVNNRVTDLLDAAAVLFAAKGYHRTTIRDVTSAIGMGPGSSYYHFSSKAEMLLAVYEEGIRRVEASVVDALAAASDDQPWTRLEAALSGHVAAVLDPTAYARTIVAVLPGDVPELTEEITARRDAYEAQWRDLVDALDAPVDPDLFRVFLLGAANSTQVWYREGGAPPDAIARFIVDILRRPLEGQA